jgi:hypothetical protein
MPCKLAVVASAVLVVTLAAGAPVTTGQSGSQAPGRGAIAGVATKPDSAPVPRVRLRLRNVKDGRIAGTAVANDQGQFRFDRVEEGVYAVELVNDEGNVIAVGPLVSVNAGETAVTFVRLSAQTPWFNGFFSNAAAAAIATASSLGVTAVGSNGLPVSPQ